MKKIELGTLELDEMLSSCDAARKTVDAIAKVLVVVVQKPLPKVVNSRIASRRLAAISVKTLPRLNVK